MRELNIDEIDSVSGGNAIVSFIVDYVIGKAIDALITPMDPCSTGFGTLPAGLPCRDGSPSKGPHPQ
jgi:hypothetical protein